MRREVGPVAAGIISTVVGGLVLTGITWAFGQLPTAWGYAVSGWLAICASAKTVVSWLKIDVAVPLWAIVLAAIILAFVYRVTNARARSVQSATPVAAVSTTPGAVAAPLEPEYSENELAVLIALANGDGRWFHIDELADATHLKALLVEQAVESLDNKDLLATNHNYIHGTSFRLSSKGRDWVISAGLV